MRYNEIIKNIRTIRDYKKKKVPNDLLSELITETKEDLLSGSKSDIDILLIEDGESFYNEQKGKVGYFGKTIPAPHYILLVSKKVKNYVENSAYVMENLRLKAWDKGLGTCWLTIEEEMELSKILKIDGDFTPAALIAVGYQYKGLFKTDFSRKSSRKGIEELTYDSQWGQICSGEILEERGLVNILYYTRLAPSWGNQQPWRFILTDDKVILTISKENEFNRLDAGIVMLYFEKVANEEGIEGKWILDVEDLQEAKELDIPGEFEIVGYFNI